MTELSIAIVFALVFASSLFLLTRPKKRNSCMLKLSRKPGESLTFLFEGRVIRVDITDVNGDRVRIGIEADSDVKILRTELLEDSHARETVHA